MNIIKMCPHQTHHFSIVLWLMSIHGLLVNWQEGEKQKKKSATASSNLMAKVSEPVVTEPITVDAACQTTCPSIEGEVQKVASAKDLCVKKGVFDTESDSDISMLRSTL